MAVYYRATRTDLTKATVRITASAYGKNLSSTVAAASVTGSLVKFPPAAPWAHRVESLSIRNSITSTLTTSSTVIGVLETYVTSGSASASALASASARASASAPHLVPTTTLMQTSGIQPQQTKQDLEEMLRPVNGTKQVDHATAEKETHVKNGITQTA
eukprot:gnl/MRDRNA2_/MRDRNA2_303224_c0_seq1.p1 gnl/MRDRNA2_/MRDRNA2_303224_c0~~gnl/MRDRNA2_/MRDRNA2_303224_c0_seq1.p1  ORF type:complete len:173 (+),score=24.87 gnl/MRDRNA2_/MRDRNA2_303224_c0_seq1:45-521(+)